VTLFLEFNNFHIRRLRKVDEKHNISLDLIGAVGVGFMRKCVMIEVEM
jgi:hypothetical protein